MLGVRDRRGPSSSLSVHRASVRHSCVIRSRPSPVPPRAISHHAVAELVTLDPRAARGLGLERPRAARPNERLLVNLHRKYLLAYAARRRSSSPPGAWPRRPRRRKGPPPQPTARARNPRHRRQPRHQQRVVDGSIDGSERELEGCDLAGHGVTPRGRRREPRRRLTHGHALTPAEQRADGNRCEQNMTSVSRIPV